MSSVAMQPGLDTGVRRYGRLRPLSLKTVARKRARQTHLVGQTPPYKLNRLFRKRRDLIDPMSCDDNALGKGSDGEVREVEIHVEFKRDGLFIGIVREPPP